MKDTRTHFAGRDLGSRMRLFVPRNERLKSAKDTETGAAWRVAGPVLREDFRTGPPSICSASLLSLKSLTAAPPCNKADVRWLDGYMAGWFD